MYKSDWVTTRGFDTQKYTTKWGGEDWDAVDRCACSSAECSVVVTLSLPFLRIRGQGLELFRLGYPGLVHYFHSKSGMWGH